LQESSNGFLGTPYGIAILFAIFWCFICFVTSFMSGWLTLSRRFRKQSEPYGATMSVGPLFYTVYTRYWAHYSSIIRMTAAEDGLYLSVLFLYRVAHPPLCIPWNEVKISKKKFVWRWYVVLTLGEQERIPLRITQRMARKLGILDRLPDESKPLQ
jgi:hypothetical protein